MILFLSGEKKLATPLFFEKVKKKKIASPLFVCQKFGKPPLSLSKKFEIPRKNPLPHPAVYTMNAALMEVQLYTEWDDNHVCMSTRLLNGLRGNPI